MPPDDPCLSPEAIAEASASASCPLTLEQADRLSRYAALLRKWNRVHNLTALDRPEEILTHHLLDCLAIAPEVDRTLPTRPRRILDVGSGAGLPGLVLAAVLPDAEVTVVDRVQKKTAFLQQAVIEMKLGNVRVLHARIETVRGPRFEGVVSRAFADLAEMVRLTIHLIAPGGLWMAMKGAYPADEVAALPETVAFVRAVKLQVPLLAAVRHLVVLRPR